MSYPSGQMVPGAPGRVRPASVTVSSYLLFLLAAVQVISALMSFLYIGDIQRVYEDAFANVEGGDAATSIASVTLIGAAVFGLVIAAGLVTLAVFNNRGKNPSRITTWVIGGIFLCCGGCNLIGTVAGGSMNLSSTQSDPDVPTNQEIQEMLNDVLPSWYTPTTVVLSVLTMLALLAALILLALPPSNEFFRKPQAEWQPPMPGQPGYVAYPAYPAGQPTQPGQPPAMPPAAPGMPPAGVQPPAAAPAQPDTPPADTPPASGQPSTEPPRPEDRPEGA